MTTKQAVEAVIEASVRQHFRVGDVVTWEAVAALRRSLDSAFDSMNAFEPSLDILYEVRYSDGKLGVRADVYTGATMVEGEQS